MSHTFKTFADAMDAGYRRVNRRTDRDISGINCFGYDYRNADGETTVTVWGTEERNKGGNDLGAFRAMYPPLKAE